MQHFCNISCLLSTRENKFKYFSMIYLDDSDCAIIRANLNMNPKILMFGWELPPHNSGGLGVACEGLARALAEEGAEITFVLPRKIGTPQGLSVIFANVPRIKVTEADTALIPYETDEQYRVRREDSASSCYGTNLFAEIERYGYSARAIARTETFDLIHAHDWLSFRAGVEAKRVSGKPLVLHVHITSFEQSGSDLVDPRVYTIEKESMQYADKIIAVSHSTKNIIVNRYGIPEHKIAVVHNGINPNDYDRSPTIRALDELKSAGNQIVLFLGRITLHKGPDYFMRAAEQVLRYRPNTYFIMAGSGDMEAAMIREAARRGIAHRLFFAGFVRGDEQSALYRAADLFILPSVAEPFGITPLESLAHGTPVIISKQAGVGEVLRNALKVDFWDVDEMANKIVAVLEHKPLQKLLREEGRREALSQTWRKAAEKCVELYRRLLQTFVTAR